MSEGALPSQDPRRGKPEKAIDGDPRGRQAPLELKFETSPVGNGSITLRLKGRAEAREVRRVRDNLLSTFWRGEAKPKQNLQQSHGPGDASPKALVYTASEPGPTNGPLPCRRKCAERYPQRGALSCHRHRLLEAAGGSPQAHPDNMMWSRRRALDPGRRKENKKKRLYE